MNIETKDAAFDLAEMADDGTFEGYASVFGNVDRGGDVVAPGAFARSLGARKAKMLWQHDPGQVIGVWDSIAEDERGLRVKGKLLLGIERGREAYELLRAKALDGMSIGYRTVRAEAAGNARKLVDVDLFEISLVTFPMNEAATVTAVKSADGEWDIRKLERALRDAVGMSQKEAKALLADGFKALKATRDVDASEAESEGLAALFAQLTQLKEKIQ